MVNSQPDKFGRVKPDDTNNHNRSKQTTVELLYKILRPTKFTIGGKLGTFASGGSVI